MRNERDERLTALAGPMARAVVAAAPSGWTRAVLRAYATPFRTGAHVTYESPGGRRRIRAAGLDAELAVLLELAKGPGAGLAADLTVEPPGRYELVVTPRSERGLSSGGTYVCVLDAGYSPPVPGESQDGPADATEAGDPDEAVRLLGEYLERRAEILGTGPDTLVPVPAGRLDELEERGGRLPADLRALYERAGHAPHAFHWRWLSVEELLGGDPVDAREWAQDGADLVFDADPPNTVRRVTGHAGWIPFAHDGSGNYLAVDMVPAADGRPGQIIAIGNDYADGPGYVAESVTALLRGQLARLEAGEYEIGEGWDGRRYLTLDGDHWHQDAQDVREQTFGGGFTVSPELQRLTVMNGGRPDLGPLRDAPLLRHLWLECEEADLTPLADLPIERLFLITRAADLTPLTGHPTLGFLALTADRPVGVACLATIPGLHHLDLSRAAVTDLTLLADLPSLRTLYLSPEQWREFRERSDRHPPLALAGIVGDLTSAEAAEWADEFPGAPADPLLRHSGTLPDS